MNTLGHKPNIIQMEEKRKHPYLHIHYLIKDIINKKEIYEPIRLITVGKTREDFDIFCEIVLIIGIPKYKIIRQEYRIQKQIYNENYKKLELELMSEENKIDSNLKPNYPQFHLFKFVNKNKYIKKMSLEQLYKYWIILSEEEKDIFKKKYEIEKIQYEKNLLEYYEKLLEYEIILKKLHKLTNINKMK
jgi:hypothetical protein